MCCDEERESGYCQERDLILHIQVSVSQKPKYNLEVKDRRFRTRRNIRRKIERKNGNENSELGNLSLKVQVFGITNPLTGNFSPSWYQQRSWNG
jgi:hypothetical protein